MKPATRCERSGEVRIIGGQWRRSKLAVADRPGLRPTPDRVRETLFNWLGQDLNGWRVLDAFAGSGALGFEAGSRGASMVVMLERDAALCALMRQSRERLKADCLQIEQADALAWMRRQATERGATIDPASPPIDLFDPFDLILLDPPFDADWFAAALRLAMPLLRPGGCLYLEAPAQWMDPLPGAALHRHLRAGAVHAHLWIKER